MPNKRQRVRVLSILLVMLAAFLGLSWRLTYLQVVRHDELTDQADAERRRVQILPAQRGDIRDRNGALLATSVPVRTVFLDAHAWAEKPPPSEAKQRLIQLLGLDGQGFEEKLASDKRFIVLRRKVPEETVEKLRALKVRALGYEEDLQRYAPLGQSLCHALGFVDFDHHGVQGIERSMEIYLAGQAGWRTSPKDNRGREIVAWRQEEVPARDGYDVELTIDHVIQDIAESELAKAVEALRPLGACAIVMQPRTGEILALANWPTFDPNCAAAAPIEHQKNLAIVNIMEPGSTFKIVTAAGALNDNTVTLDDVLYCENGAFTYEGKILRDAHPHGNLSVQQIIQKSSNIGAAKIGLKMGEERLYHYIEAFGFGSRTGIDLPAEIGGIVHPVNHWSKLEITRIPMGQSIAVTSLQMIRAMCALANGGDLMQPLVVHRVIAKDGTPVAQFPSRLINRPITRRTAALMNQALKSVPTAEGTAQKAALADWTVAGKTGTAQKYENGQPSHTKFIGSFIGYLPADHPQICILVMLDEPQGAYYGGDVAAPVFHEMAERIAPYLNIPAETPENPSPIAAAKVSNPSHARKWNSNL